MTREEALKKIKAEIRMYDEESPESVEWEECYEALKQTNVLDKIRDEAKELDGKYLIGDYGIYGENIPKYVRLWDVLSIIDKYKAESEVKE